MTEKKAEREPNKHDSTAPAAWGAGVAAHFIKAFAFSVECRKGPRGAPRTLKTVATSDYEDVSEDADDLRELGQEVAQALWDEAYEYHFDVGGTVDAVLVVHGHDGEIARVTAGGRMRGGETEDPEGGDDVPTMRTMLGAIKRLTELHLATVERTNEIISNVAPLFADAAKVREAEINAEAEAYKIHQVETILDRAMDRFGPAVDKAADAFYQDRVSGRSRKPSGDKLIDAWRTVVETMDLPSVARVRSILSDVDGADLFDALEVGDAMGSTDIVDFWKEFRERDAVKEKWRELLAAMPARAASALPAFADAVRAAA